MEDPSVTILDIVDYNPNENDIISKITDPILAYNLAISGKVIFTYDVGTLQASELRDITKYPPIVDAKTYILYQSKPLSELIQLTDYITSSRQRCFFYLTREYELPLSELVPNDPNIRPNNIVVTRSDIYDRLIVSKPLIDYIYQNRNIFINTPAIHPLEKYIVQFDTFVSQPEAIFNISVRMGVNVYFSFAYPIEEQFIDFVSDYLLRVEPLLYSNPSFPGTSVIINATETSWRDLLISIGREQFIPFHYSRMNYIGQVFQIE